jgi:hypothetical protein
MGHGLDPRPRGGCLKGGRTEQPDLDLRPFTGISLPYGDWNTGLGGFEVPYLSTSMFERCENQITGSYLDAYPRNPT